MDSLVLEDMSKNDNNTNDCFCQFKISYIFLFLTRPNKLWLV